MSDRTLITTSLQDTWPKGGPVIFLGEWCRRYSSKTHKQYTDYEVFPCVWDNRSVVQTEHIKLIELYEEVINKLADKMNHIHQTDYSVRFWKILLGPWLHRFIRVLYDRWLTLKKISQSSQSLSCIVSDGDIKHYIPNDTMHFIQLVVDDPWNEMMYAYLAKEFFSDKIKQNILPYKIHCPPQFAQEKISIAKKLITKALFLYNKIFTGNQNHFFIATRLYVFTELRLQIKLGQIPKLWRTPKVGQFEVNNTLRNWGLDNMNGEFKQVLNKMLPTQIPRVYLEGFKQTVKQVESNCFPKTPKSIFTSNSYAYDDVFKLWTGLRTEVGTKLIIGQHGGFYGTSSLSIDEYHIKDISDTFLTWGWGETNNQNIVPIGKFTKTPNRCFKNPNGGAILVQISDPRYRFHLSSHGWQHYFADQLKFVNALPEKIAKNITVKTYPADYGQDQRLRWETMAPEVIIASSDCTMKKALQENRVCISTYNASTFLETLSMNYPTLMFWNPKHWEMREEARSYFETLEKTGIFHSSPESAAKQLAMIWDGVADWWQSAEVQGARKTFCNRFASTPVGMLDSLKTIMSNR